MSDIRALISEKVGEPFGLFFCSGEGNHLPNGEEESSGCVVTRSGRHFDFWTGWNAQTGQETLKHWHAIVPCVDWFEVAEYVDAVAEAAS